MHIPFTGAVLLGFVFVHRVCVCVWKRTKKKKRGLRLYLGSVLYARTKALEKGVAIVASPSIRQHTSAYVVAIVASLPSSVVREFKGQPIKFLESNYCHTHFFTQFLLKNAVEGGPRVTKYRLKVGGETDVC